MSRQFIKSHMDFWRLSPVEKPLLGTMLPMFWIAKPYPLKGGRNVAGEPEQIDPRQVDVYHLLGGEREELELFTGDFINPVRPVHPTAWLEGVIGCPIYVSAYGCVAKPVELNLSQLVSDLSVEMAMQSPWLQLMDEVLQRARELADERYPVCQLHFRGIIDLLAALLGEDQLCMEIHDHQTEVERLADALSSIWIALAKRQLSQRGRWEGGFVSTWGLYTPAESVDYQIDASSLFSPKQYRDIFVRWDQRILAEFPHFIIHLHACGLHHVPAILELGGSGAIEIHLDRETGVWDMEALITHCQMIQEAGKRVVIWGELADNELAEVSSRLSPSGLAVLRWPPDTHCTEDA